MTRTIQNTRTRCFLEHAAGVYGVVVPAEVLDDIARFDELDALATAFPWLGDAELSEALWALGHFDR